MSHNPSRSQDKTHYNSFFVKQIMFIKYQPYKMRHEQKFINRPQNTAMQSKNTDINSPTNMKIQITTKDNGILSFVVRPSSSTSHFMCVLHCQKNL